MDERKSGLSPVVGDLPQTLILGSFPGEESLRRREYYANPRNQFWKIVISILGTADPHHYERRKELLKAHRIALWDVVSSCERRGSADASIRNAQPNDLCRFLRDNPSVRVVCLNGGKAAEAFQRLIAPRCRRVLDRILVSPLPSTSPANARQGLDEKVTRWRSALEHRTA